jgi:hypothetical protein
MVRPRKLRERDDSDVFLHLFILHLVLQDEASTGIPFIHIHTTLFEVRIDKRPYQMKISLLLLCTLAQVMAFAPNGLTGKSRTSVAFRRVETPLFLSPSEESSTDESVSVTGRSHSPVSRYSTAAAGLASVFFAFVPTAMAYEAELAELPNPVVPVIFSVGLLVGVGVLTGTLGDVIDQEAMLGMQSGARAKKDIERSRSSYFKKK